MPPNVPNTLLPLETFRRISGWHKYFFWQLSNQDIPLTDSSDLLVMEHTWQKPMTAARSDIRQAIAVAEQKLQTALGYDVSTRYRQDAVVFNSASTYSGPSYGRPYYGYGYGGAAYGNNLMYLPVGKIQRLATLNYTELGEAAITLSDSDGDNLDDTFTGTFADAVTDPADVVVSISASDQPDSYVTDDSTSPADWQLRPVKVTRPDAATLKITGPAWIVVKPALYEHATPAAGYNNSSTGVNSSGAIDPDTATNFVSGVTLYKKVYSNEGQATLVRKYGAVEALYPVTATVVNAELGQVAINLGGCCDTVLTNYGCGYVTSEEIRFNYEAGATRQGFKQSGYLQYQSEWDVITARFAVAELAQVQSAQEKHNPFFSFYREDLALVGNGTVNNLYRVDNDILANKFRNTRRGAVEAWQAVATLAQVRAINLG